MPPELPEGLIEMGVWFDAATGAYKADEPVMVGLGVLVWVLCVTLGAITARAVLP